LIIDEDEHALMHYGILRKSGRYPWGSGETQSARNKSFLDHVEELKRQGLSEPEIAKGLGIVDSRGNPSTTALRAAKSIAKNEQKQSLITQAQALRDKGYSNVAIGERMGINESSVRSLLAPGQKDRTDVLHTTAAMLRDQVEQKEFLDVGTGAENHIGISKEKLNTAVALLREEGYELRYVKVRQLGTGKETNLKVLTKPGVPYSELAQNKHKIRQVTDFSEDGGRSFLGLHEPLSISSSRIGVRYKEEGGADADGVIFVRPGVDDISLGKSRYAQVRIAVDGTHYLKGMAMYKDDLPDGVDLLFNTNKSNTGNKHDAMKELKDDADNPFGAVVRQRIERGLDGVERVTSVMNIVGSPTKEGSGEEGSWETWSKSLSTQFLSKQSPTLAKSQLDLTYANRKADLDEILSLTNPVVRKKLLESFADNADSASVHLKAAALPRQASHVILPINSLKDTEVYAPNYRNGERVALVRYPHGGKFEIPELTVNNNHPEGKNLLGQARDAIGINSKVAERLSGADFDGDTVLVIPNNHGRVKSEPALEGLKNFDPKASYPAYEGMPKMSAKTKQLEMGKVSNLITDMTIRGATNAELARAVRHSMVVIDAEKHNLNYKESARRNGIADLKKKYQAKPDGSAGGAATLISRATSEVRVEDRKLRSASQGGAIDRETGKLQYVPTGKTTINAKGETVPKMIRSVRLAETDDAHTLSSGTKIEELYADHSNRLKALANDARKQAVSTKTKPMSPSAKAVYAKEADTLKAKLNVALKNAPLERQAQLLANTAVSAKRQADPEMDAATLKKIKSQALIEARSRTGAKKQRIDITPSEWDAIQAGAISDHMLSQILSNADMDQVKQLATPKSKTLMTSIKTQRAQAMLSSGYTQAEVADALGVSVSTLKNAVHGE
jgi:DNA-binding CsgD family transcriptional regulator